MRRDQAQAAKAKAPLDPVAWARANPAHSGGSRCRLCLRTDIAEEIRPVIVAIKAGTIDSTVQRLRLWLAQERGVSVSQATMWRHARECVK